MNSKGNLESIYKGVGEVLLPKSQQIHTHINQFLSSQIKDFQKINRENDKVLDRLREDYDLYERTLSQLKNKLKKDDNFIKGSVNFLKAKEDQLSSKNKILTSISTGLKESVAKVKPEKLAHLPYEKQTILKDLFVKLFVVLYNEPSSKYDWKIFKEKALLHYKGEDFLTRLANINFKDLSESNYEELLKLKNDEQFKDACENSAYAVHIVDLADWVDYVCEGHKVNKEKKQTEHQYHKILADKEKRAGKNVQLKEEFCSETLKDIDNYQSNINWLQSEFRTLIVGMNTSIEDIKELEQARDEKIKKINAM